jgi:hypothetical protein
MVLVIHEDLVVGEGTGIAGPERPAHLADAPLARLRWSNGAIIDVADVTQWFIGHNGTKHLTDAPGRQLLTCAWDAKIEHVNGAWAVVDPAEVAKRALKAAAQAKRQRVVAGGCTVTVDGIAIPIWADDRTIATLTALAVRAAANPALIVPQWRARDGSFYELNAADIAVMSDGLFAFINEAFEVEGEVAADIDAENITTLAEIEAADWPEN